MTSALSSFTPLFPLADALSLMEAASYAGRVSGPAAHSALATRVRTIPLEHASFMPPLLSATTPALCFRLPLYVNRTAQQAKPSRPWPQNP